MTATTHTPETDAATSRVHVEVDPHGGRARVRIGTDARPTAPVLRPWLHRTDDTGAVVSLVPEGAMLLAGDHVRVELRVGPGARLDVVEPAGTVAYPMHATPGACAVWEVDVRLDEGASLRWLSQPFVVAEGAVVRRSTRVAMGAGSRLLLRETIVLGRAGEAPGTLSSSLRVADPDRPVVVEDLDLGPAAPPLLLGRSRVLDTLLLLGEPVPGGTDQGRLDLDAGGHLWRSLVVEAHESPLGSVLAAIDAGRRG